MIVFDLETTGLPKAEGSDLNNQPKIIEFGAIKLDDNLKEISRLEFFCNPGHELNQHIIKITGITDEMLKDEKPFVAYYKDLCDFFLGEREIVAHNLQFDRKILRFELERIDKITKFPWPPDHICTVEIGQRVWGQMRKLGSIYEELFGMKIEGAHRSINDVEATVKIVEWYKKEGHL
jgi:DNA polymerase-3 subunit alpha (Gram-positive type)|tara:strand:+ start:38 stop:571 length:534 start_codon:yes stop_codon:yes gene_type:complete